MPDRNKSLNIEIRPTGRRWRRWEGRITATAPGTADFQIQFWPRSEYQHSEHWIPARSREKLEAELQAVVARVRSQEREIADIYAQTKRTSA